MKMITDNQTLEHGVISWLMRLFPSTPSVRDYIKSFPNVDKETITSCVSELVEKGYVAPTSLRYKNETKQIYLEGMVLTDEGCIYGDKLASNKSLHFDR